MPVGPELVVREGSPADLEPCLELARIAGRAPEAWFFTNAATARRSSCTGGSASRRSAAPSRFPGSPATEARASSTVPGSGSSDAGRQLVAQLLDSEEDRFRERRIRLDRVDEDLDRRRAPHRERQLAEPLRRLRADADRA